MHLLVNHSPLFPCLVSQWNLFLLCQAAIRISERFTTYLLRLHLPTVQWFVSRYANESLAKVANGLQLANCEDPATSASATPTWPISSSASDLLPWRTRFSTMWSRSRRALIQPRSSGPYMKNAMEGALVNHAMSFTGCGERALMVFMNSAVNCFSNGPGDQLPSPTKLAVDHLQARLQ